MGKERKVWSILACCVFVLPKCIVASGYHYAHTGVNQYKITNGRYQIIPPPPPPPKTTPEPTLLETIFGLGDAYKSDKTPAEDAAILNSISDDPEPSDAATGTDSKEEGLSSWLPSLPSLPGFGSSSKTTTTTSTTTTTAKPKVTISDYFKLLSGSGSNNIGSNNKLNFHNSASSPYGASSQMYPVVLPGPENPMATGYSPPAQHYPMFPSVHEPAASQQHTIILPGPENGPAMGHSTRSPSYLPIQPQAQQDYQISPPNYIHQELNSNINPTFQFHQQIKDSIPTPSLSLPGFGSQMFPYPYTSPANLVNQVMGPQATTEKSVSYLEMLTNYFSFGKRSDSDSFVNLENMSVARSLDTEAKEETAEDDDDEEEEDEDTHSDDEKRFFDSDNMEDVSDNKSDKAFPCPKSGIWKWNGEVCLAVGPIPTWACKPNDLIVSGKIAICRNKIYFSPKVINKRVME